MRTSTRPRRGIAYSQCNFAGCPALAVGACSSRLELGIVVTIGLTHCQKGLLGLGEMDQRMGRGLPYFNTFSSIWLKSADRQARPRSSRLLRLSSISRDRRHLWPSSSLLSFKSISPSSRSSTRSSSCLCIRSRAWM